MREHETQDTAIAQRQPVGVMRFTIRSESSAEAAEWNRMCLMAQAFSESDLVPEQFRRKPENCLIAGQLAKRMEVDLFMLMQNMYVVHGRPGLEAKFAIAMCNSKGVFRGPIRFELSGEGDTRSCRAHAVDRDSGETVDAVCDMSIAKAEGWLDKNGSKWRTMPDLMLQYRSAMFLIRLHCPEVLMGMQTVDELVDITGQQPSNGSSAVITSNVNESDLNSAVDDLARNDEGESSDDQSDTSEAGDSCSPSDQQDTIEQSETVSEPRRSRPFKELAAKIEEYAGDEDKLFAMQPEISEAKLRDGEREELESRLGAAVNGESK